MEPTGSVPSGARSVPDNRIVSLFEDEAGRIWVSSGRGVGYFEASWSQQFESHRRHRAGLRVRAGAAAQTCGWRQSDGLYRWNESDGLRPVPEFAGKRVNAIHQAADGTLWAGTQADGLLRLTDGRWQPVTDSASGELLFNDIVVNGIDETSDGSLWVGTYNDGLWRLRDGRWERLDARLASPKVLSLSAAGKQLWVGTRQGLAGFDGQTWQSFSGDVLPNPGVLALAPAEDGALWIGTMGGLAQYRPETTPPWVAIESLNLTSLTEGEARLDDDVLQAVRVAGGDLATRSDDLLYLTQIEGVDVEPQVHKEPLITGYSDVKLAPGSSHIAGAGARCGVQLLGARRGAVFRAAGPCPARGPAGTRRCAVLRAWAGYPRAGVDGRIGRGQPAVTCPQPGVDRSGGRAAAGSGRTPLQPLHLR